jgi:ribosomal protein L37AE/L43A
VSCGKRHIAPVHFNRGRHGHVWICVSCGKQISGTTLEAEEIEALMAFSKALEEKMAKK